MVVADECCSIDLVKMLDSIGINQFVRGALMQENVDNVMVVKSLVLLVGCHMLISTKLRPLWKNDSPLLSGGKDGEKKKKQTKKKKSRHPKSLFDVINLGCVRLTICPCMKRFTGQPQLH